MRSVHDPRYIELIHHLTRLRKSKRLTQADIANRLGIDRTHVTKTETMVRRLDIIELCDWLEVLGCSLEDFMRDINVGLKEG